MKLKRIKRIKKIIFSLMSGLLLLNPLMSDLAYGVSITYDTFITADDVTIDRLSNNFNVVVNNLNSFPGENIQANTISVDTLTQNANPEYRWGEAFGNWVYSGLLPTTTSGTLVGTIPSGIAYVEDATTRRMSRVMKDDTSKTFTAIKNTYVDLSNTGVFTYTEVAQDAEEPVVASNSIRLCMVSTDGVEVGAVTDKRVMAPTFSTSGIPIVLGCDISTTSGDTAQITVDAGVLYHGSTSIVKTSAQVLNLGTNGDWADGSTDSVDAWCYVGIKNTGNFKLLGNNAPNRTDVSGNSNGPLFYYYDGADYWRVVGRISNDNTVLAWPFYQTGDTIYYYDPQSFTCGTSTSFSEVDITGVTSAVDDGVLIVTTNSEAAGGTLRINAFRNAISDIGGSIGSVTTFGNPSVHSFSSLAAQTVGWFSISTGSTYARAIDYGTNSGTVTGYVAAIKL